VAKPQGLRASPAQIRESIIQFRVSSIVNPESCIQYRVSRIENPTLAHFRHFIRRGGFSSLFTNLPSTSVENPLQINPFYAKQTQFPKSQMNVNLYNTTDYENKRNWTLGENKPNQSQFFWIPAGVYPTRSLPRTEFTPHLDAGMRGRNDKTGG